MGWRDEAILVSGPPRQQPAPPEVQPLDQPPSRGAPSWRDEAVLVRASRSPVEAQLSQGSSGPGLSPEAQEHAVGEATRQLEASMTPGFLAWGTEAGADIVSPIARVVGQGGYADAMNRWSAAMEQAQRQREAGGIVPDILQRGVRGAGRSALPMVAAAQAGGPYAAIGVAAAQETNRAITEGKDAGLKGWDLTQYAVAQGVVEALPAYVMQKLGLGGAESIAAAKGIISGGVKEALKTLGFSAAMEVIEENVTEVSHNVAAAVLDVDDEALTAERTWETVKDTTVQTLLTVGGLGGVQIARGGANARRRQDVREIAESGKPASRSQWASLGLPKYLGKNAEQRTRYIAELDRSFQLEDELASREGEDAAEQAPQEQIQPEVVSEEFAGLEPAGPPVTGIKNEIVNRLREEQGRGAITPDEAQSQAEWLGNAEQMIAGDPAISEKLISDLKENPRPLGPNEVAVLQIHYGRAQQSLRQANESLAVATESGDAAAVERAQSSANAVVDKINSDEHTLHSLKREMGRGFAALKMMLRDDFSLASMSRKLGIAKGGKDVTAEELTKIQELDRRITELQEKLDLKEAEIESREVEEEADATDRKRKKGLKRGTAEQKRTEAYKRGLRKRITDYTRRISEGDLSKRKTRKTILDKEAVDLKYQLEKIKGEFKAMEDSAKWQQKSLAGKSVAQVHEALNASRAILTSMDLSAMLRQGGLVAVSHPWIATKAVLPMLGAFVSKKSAFKSLDALKGHPKDHPNTALRQKAGLAVTRVDGPLSAQEEAFQGTWTKHIPLVAASERAYVTFLNTVRAGVFDSMTATLGVGGNVTLDEAKMIANYVNVITGRGGLGKAEQAATTLATYFFAPRYVMSRFQYLAGMPAWQSKGRARKLIAKEYAKTVLGMGTFVGSLLTLANLFRDEDDPLVTVEFDSRSADFLKPRIGNTRIDPLAGLSQVTVLLRRLQTGQRKTSTGKIVDIRGPGRKFTGLSAADVMANFMRSKLSPVIGTAVDMLAGENLVGEPTTPQSVARGTMVPLAINDILEVMTEDYNIPTKVATSLLTIFGAGAQTYDSATPGRFAEDIAAHPKIIGVNENGETYDHTDEIAQVVAEASRLGHSPEDMMYDMDERMRASGVRSASRAAKLKRFLERWNLFSDLQQQL